MLYKITDGTVSVGGKTVLEHIDFEIKGSEKIAVVGANGAGKTTLLKLIAGELKPDRDDRRKEPCVFMSRRLSVGMLRQDSGFAGDSRTVEELLAGEILAENLPAEVTTAGNLPTSCREWESFSRRRYDRELEYDRIFTRFGFSKADKKRKLSEFSGGQQTKIALIRLLLEKPDILLLDEPTNHLDLETVQWLEGYIRGYEHAVIMVSHDRFFLDQTAEAVWELAGRSLTRYPGNYTRYRQEKVRRIASLQKACARRLEETRRLEELIERFKHKPRKAAFARSRKKILERLPMAEKPVPDDVHIFTGPITPLIPGSKQVLEAEHLTIGYDRPLLEISLRVRRGQKIGVLGPNGAGKSTFLKTISGHISPLKGKFRLGDNITIGYFSQHSAEITSDQTVAEHFRSLFPALTEKEARSVLGAYLFTGRTAGQKVSSLSGGEKARLVLAELLQSRPNLLILDEPTNHMDIQAMETLESAFKAYEGTILFASHDRYFIRQIAESMLIFENGAALYYPFGYEHYLRRLEQEASGSSIPARINAENQALTEAIRSVPKAERFRLREIPTEEAWSDWQLRLAGERLKAAREHFQKLWEELESMKFVNAAGMPEPESFREEEYRQLQLECDEAWQRWHEECLSWYDTVNSLPDCRIFSDDAMPGERSTEQP